MTTPGPAPTVALPSGERVPALGLGTWRMGEEARTRDAEIAAIRHAVDVGYRLFDTAEMYGEGGAETVLGRALADALRAGAIARDDVYVVSKVYPHHADRAGVAAACARSRARLQLDTIDLYLLHWRGAVPLAETVDAFEAEVAKGTIHAWGVSNFDVDDLVELANLDHPTLTARHKLRCATNQVCYALDERGIEFSLATYQRTLHMPVMAYCPLGQGGLATDATLAAIGEARGATAAQVALAWTMRHGDVIAIPKAVDPRHLTDNFGALAIALTDDELARIDAAWPPPTRKMPLAVV